MHQLRTTATLLPPHVAEAAGRLGMRLDLSVTVKGYGTGRLALVAR